MRTTTAYFAGVGTVAVAIAAGLGGGLLFSNIVAPHQPKYATEPTKLELRMAERSMPVSSPPSEPAPAIAATRSPAPQPSASTAPIVAAAPAPAEPQKELPAAAAPAEQKAASNTPAAQPATSAAPADQTAREPAASPREAFAKSRDVDLKRAATEKRRAERHQQWADKRRVRQPREQDLEVVEQAVRDDTEPRRAFASEPVRLETRRIKLFGDD